MGNAVVHFAIHADDVERARAFYAGVFGWRFEAWGPPGFYRILDSGIEGALHARNEPLEGRGMRGFECTIAVDDLDAIKERIRRCGGTIVLDDFDIPTVGTLVQFADTEGNVAGAMRYLSDQ